ncbi:hypothetical protein AAFF_G00265140, partial [Aldrovandia affinis]
ESRHVFTAHNTYSTSRGGGGGGRDGGTRGAWTGTGTGNAPVVLVILLPLHPPVLEPDFDLALGQAERVRDLDAPPAREVPVEVELLL